MLLSLMSLKHMRTLIVLVVGLLAVGCETPLPQRPKAKPVKELMLADQNSTKAEPAKELTPEQKQKKALGDSVVGEYEFENDGSTYKLAILENGVLEYYSNDEKVGGVKWLIVDGEIHAGSGFIHVWRFNIDKSITLIANLRDGKRQELSKEDQETYKKIK